MKYDLIIKYNGNSKMDIKSKEKCLKHHESFETQCHVGESSVMQFN